MRRFALITALIIVLTNLGVSSGAATVGAPPTTPLESLTFVTSTGVTVDSPAHPGRYLGHPVLRGLELGPTQYSSVALTLGGQYETLAGIVYVNDAQKSKSSFTISGSDAHGSRSLYSIALGSEQRASFKIRVHGLTSLTLSMGVTGLFDVVADLTAEAKAPVGPSGPQVLVRYPVGGAGVAAGIKVPFAWQPFPGATSYVLQLWLTQQTGTTPISATTSITLSTLVFGKTTYLWDTTGFLPGVYQYDLIPFDALGNALAPRNNPQQITLAS